MGCGGGSINSGKRSNIAVGLFLRLPEFILPPPPQCERKATPRGSFLCFAKKPSLTYSSTERHKNLFSKQHNSRFTAERELCCALTSHVWRNLVRGAASPRAASLLLGTTFSTPPGAACRPYPRQQPNPLTPPGRAAATIRSRSSTVCQARPKP